MIEDNQKKIKRIKKYDGKNSKTKAILRWLFLS